MSVWYHYIRETNLKKCLEHKALFGRSPFIRREDTAPTLPQEACRKAIWGFREDNPNIIDKLREDIAHGERLYLLEIETQASDEIYVCDTSVFKSIREEKFPDNIEWDSLKGKELRSAYNEQSKLLYAQYWESLVPFSQYVSGNYAEPEIVCFNDIPFDRIKCIHKTDEFKSPPPNPKMFEFLLK